VSGADLHRRAVALAVRQRGVVRRRQLEELGASASTIATWARQGTWVPRGRLVLVLAGTPMDFVTRSLIVAQQLGADACLTGISALAIRGLLGDPPWDGLRLVGGSRGAPHALLAWPDDPLRAEEVWVLYRGSRRVAARLIRRAEPASTGVLGVRVAPAMTVMLDLLRYLPEQRARNLLMRAAGTAGWSEQLARLDLEADRLGGGRGAGRLRRLARLVESQARSEAEVVAQELLRSAGLTGWRPNHSVRIGGRRIIIDLALVPAMIAVEIDGLAFHGADRRQDDLARQNLLVGAGWTVLRFTWEDLTRRPEQVIAQIRGAVDAWERDQAGRDTRDAR
jgi:very-short-patch-repair endonuclease